MDFRFVGLIRRGVAVKVNLRISPERISTRAAPRIYGVDAIVSRMLAKTRPQTNLERTIRIFAAAFVGHGFPLGHFYLRAPCADPPRDRSRFL